MPQLHVLCRTPLPRRDDGWKFSVGPVGVARDEATPPDSPVLRLTSASFSTGLLAEALGELLARSTRGVLIAEGERLIADYDGAPLPDERSFAAQLDELISEVEAELSHEANDWSDVELAVLSAD
jgi:hypothetical protein